MTVMLAVTLWHGVMLGIVLIVLAVILMVKWEDE